MNGLLLLAVETWYRYQIITSFLVFAVGGVGMYRAVHRFKVRDSIAVLVTIIYMTIGWLPRWQSGSNFTGIGAALMPYGILVACDMFYDKEKPIHWIKLTILMTVALEGHLLTALMYMAFLVPAWLYAIIKRENKRGILLNTLKAVLLTIFLTVNTLLPLYWMSKTNNLAPTATMRMLENAVHLKHTTVAFHPFRILTHNLRASLTFWLAYAFIAQVIYAIWTREESKANVVVSLYGGFWPPAWLNGTGSLTTCRPWPASFSSHPVSSASLTPC
ncbi:6-pyruvoyl-tetrahydropterin synthase-related protein [Lactobacillus delbrueckii subsp. bulgaricus]